MILVFKLVRNHHLDQKLGKFSIKTPKSAIFPLKPFIFQNFRRLRRRKCGVLGPFGTQFLWTWGPPLKAKVPPKKTSGYNPSQGFFG